MRGWFRKRQKRREERVLKAIRRGVKYSSDISAAARVDIGRLYPILARFEADGLIESDWGWDDNIRRRIYYIKEEKEI